MPKTIKLAKGKEFTFAPAGGGGQPTKYAWDEWFSGALLMIERSEGDENDKGTITTVTVKRDYEVATAGMPPKIKTAARHRYKVCQISRLDADGQRLNEALIIKARDMTAEERADEDVLRAEEKEAKHAAKEAEKLASEKVNLSVTPTAQAQAS